MPDFCHQLACSTACARIVTAVATTAACTPLNLLAPPTIDMSLPAMVAGLLLMTSPPLSMGQVVTLRALDAATGALAFTAVSTIIPSPWFRPRARSSIFPSLPTTPTGTVVMISVALGAAPAACAFGIAQPFTVP